jgi:erythromycin esterase
VVLGPSGEQLTPEEKHQLTARFTEPTDDMGLAEAELGARSRELGHADNVEWIEKSFGKVMVFAHNGHVLKAPFRATTGIRAGAPTFNLSVIGFGRYLAERYGDDYVVISSSVDAYAEREGGPALSDFEGGPVTPTSSSADALQKVFAPLDDRLPMFVLDIRKAEGAARAELAKERDHRYQTIFVRYVALDAYDAIFHKAQMTPQKED